MTTENQAKAQYAFDQVAVHLIEQNEKSMSSTGRCLYRGLGKLRCAIGFFISDEKYEPEIEGHSVDSVIGAKISPEYCNDDFFLEKLQIVHDCNNTSEWPIKLKVFAKQFKLNDSIVDTITPNDKLRTAEDQLILDGLKELGQAMQKQRNEDEIPKSMESV